MEKLQEILFDVQTGNHGSVGVITLNRPQALNSLNHDMINTLYTNLVLWADDKNIKAVVIQSTEGRAFCAGGDIRLIYERSKSNHPDLSSFFRDEYRLNSFIFHYPKPYIAFLDGITMGGGVGISLYGSHRIGTNRLSFAMPETGIGFYPDVGGTYFLPRLTNKIGIYLGLTGAKIDSNDCLGLGIIQYKVSGDDLPKILESLVSEDYGNHPAQSVTDILKRYAGPHQEATILAQQEVIEKSFAEMTVENIIESLNNSADLFSQTALKALVKKSPMGLKVTLRAFQNSMEKNFDQCMQTEFRLTSHFLKGHDFLEGIRAAIIDKDQDPQWQPNELNLINDEMVTAYFAPISKELTLA